MSVATSTECVAFADSDPVERSSETPQCAAPPPILRFTHNRTYTLIVSTGKAQRASASDGRRRRGDESRAAVIASAVQAASRIGIEGLTFGTVAANAGVAKSNLRVLFGSKEGLQLATIATAQELFVRNVITPTLAASSAVERLNALGSSWMNYLESGLFEGGCFFCAAATELDDRDGPLRDAVRDTFGAWIGLLRDTTLQAIEAGDLGADVDADTMAFSLNAIGMAANFAVRLLRDEHAIGRARQTWANEVNRSRSTMLDPQ